MKSELTYYKNLDGVRAIAALMVMVFHFFQHYDHDTKLLKILAKLAMFGQTGVSLFFVLSGFLITRILIHSRLSPNYFKNFYIRRTLRIFPLYYLFLLIFYFVVPLALGKEIVPFGQQIYYYTYLQNFAITFDWTAKGPLHYWSLAVEEHFYLFWPLVVYYLPNKKLWGVIIGIVVIAAVLRYYLFSKGMEVFYFTFTRFDALAIGAILALLELKDNFYSYKNRNYFLLGSILVFMPTIALWVLMSGSGNDIIQVSKFILLAFTYFCLIGYVLCLSREHLINRFLTTKFLNYTGKISYGLYVFHPLVYALCGIYLSTNYFVVNLFICVGISYLVAGLSFEFFESRFLKLKSKFQSVSTKQVV
ncbi:MAG: acyltransferase [Flavobacteriales bacterium]|nr:acyltransferase [Flavobacteriales bacterium]